MNQTLADAGPLIALFDKDDANHQRVMSFMKDYRGQLITTWPVITEVMHMLNFNHQVPADFMKWVSLGGLQIFPLDQSHLPRLLKLIETYYELPSDLADTSLIVAAESTGVRKVLTIDSDFYVYRTSDGRYLENVLHG